MAAALMAARAARPWRDVEDLSERARLDARHRALLADAGALRGLAGHRHRARWAVDGVEAQLPLFAGLAVRDEARQPAGAEQPATTCWPTTACTGLTLGPHPLSLLRRQLAARRCVRSRELAPGSRTAARRVSPAW